MMEMSNDDAAMPSLASTSLVFCLHSNRLPSLNAPRLVFAAHPQVLGSLEIALFKPRAWKEWLLAEKRWRSLV